MTRTMPLTLVLVLGLSIACADEKSDDETTDGAAQDDGGDGTGGGDGTDGGDGTGGGDGTDGGDGGETSASAGCGLEPPWAAGGVQLTIDAGTAGDGERGYFLVLPEDYDPDVPHAVYLGYPGTNWVGEQIRPYLALESGSAGQNEIFVYLDPLWRDFDGWGNLGGWVLGPHAQPADGMGDLVFTEAVLDQLEAELCVDTERVFATGHSWGGDMAQVVSCFLGDRVTATAPAAANRPYWFEAGGGWTECTGDAAVWTFFGVADDHFTWQSYPGEFGDECNDFWLEEQGCDPDSAETLPVGGGECTGWSGCDSEVRYCLYGAASGHQIPDYFSGAIMEWFRSF